MRKDDMEREIENGERCLKCGVHQSKVILVELDYPDSYERICKDCIQQAGVD